MNTIEHLSYTFLLMVSSWLGSPLPEENNQFDWKIEQNWTEQEDKTWKLVISSTELPKYCKQNPYATIAFPEASIGGIDIESGGRLIYTNKQSKKKLTAIYSKSFLSCWMLIGEKTSVSYSAYVSLFGRLVAYPYLYVGGVSPYFFHHYMILIVVGFCLFLMIFGSVFLIKEAMYYDAFDFFYRQAQIIAFLLVYFPFLLVSISLYLQLVLVTIGIQLTFISFLVYVFNLSKKWSYTFSAVPIVFAFLFYFVGKHFMIVAINVPLFVMVPYMFFIALVRYNRSHSVLESILVLIVSVLVGFDLCMMLKIFDLPLLLPWTIFCFALLIFYKMYEKTVRNKFEFQNLKQKIVQDSEKMDYLEGLLSTHRDIMHDVKSPLTALNLITGTEIQSKSLLTEVSKKLQSVINRMDKTNIKSIPDWFGFNKLMRDLQYSIDEFQAFNPDAKISVIGVSAIESKVEVYLLQDIVVFSFRELFRNSIKHGKSNSIKIELDYDPILQKISIEYRDNGSGVDKSVKNFLGEKGVGDTGLGLYSIKEKLKLISGELVFVSEDSFCCKVILRTRIRESSFNV